MPLSCGLGVERVTRIELALSAWEADVLPLNYTRERPFDCLGLTHLPRQTDLPRHRTGSPSVHAALRQSADSGPAVGWKR
jgi:hypothetical protein